MTWELASLGRRSAEDILRKVYRLEIQKALNPLDRKDYDKICRHLSTELAGQAVPVEGAALKRALETLDVDWKEMPSEARSKVLSLAGSYLGAPVANRVVPKIEQTLSVEAKQLVQGTKENTIHTYDLNISANLNATDERISKFVSTSQGHFVRDRYMQKSEDFSRKAKEIVSSGLESGLGSADIAESLHRTLGDAGKSAHYWTMISMVFANRSRTLTQVASYSEAGIAQYSWESILDEATTMQCRFLHGRTFPVQNAIGKFEEVESARSPYSIKRITPFVQMSKGSLYFGSGESRTAIASVMQNVIGQRDKIGSFANAMSTEELMKAGIHAPPLHGHCRSNIVPTLGAAPPARTQVQVPAAPVVPEVTPEQQQALESLNSSADEGMVYMSDHFENSAEPQKPYTYTEMGDGEWVSKKMRLEDLVPTQNTVKVDRVRKFIENPKILERSEILVVKKGDRFYIDAGNEAALAHKLLGKRGVSVKVMDLDKPEGPPALLHTKAKEFAEALELKDGGKKARQLLREQIQEVFPGAISRVKGGAGDELLAKPVKADSELRHANGYYVKSKTPENGQIVLREERVEYSKQAMKIFEKGGINRRLEQGDDGIMALDGLRTLLHEELHGHSKFTGRSYHKIGAALEEVGTELSAQRVIDRLVPKAKIAGRTDELGMGSYQEQVRAVTQAVQSVTGKSYKESQDLIVDAHHNGVLSKEGEFDSEYHALGDFVGALAVPEDQQKAIRKKLFDAF